MKDLEKIDVIVRHIKAVQENCLLLGERLIDLGEFELGRMVICNGFRHDNSKFMGVEWEHLIQNGKPKDEEDEESFTIAVAHHNSINKHHPEAWGNIHNMPEAYIGEMCADWKTRANEFGTSVYEWIEDVAMKRFGFKKTDKIYERINYYLNLLCDKPFEEVNTKKG